MIVDLNHKSGERYLSGSDSVSTITPSDTQKRAIDAIKHWFKNETEAKQVFRLFGYAGTGKSTVLKFALEELGLSLLAAGRWAEAEDALARAVASNERLADAWIALGEIRAAYGDGRGSREAYQRHTSSSGGHPRSDTAHYANPSGLSCANPRCITRVEPRFAPPDFRVSVGPPIELKCEYCERIILPDFVADLEHEGYLAAADAAVGAIPLERLEVFTNEEAARASGRTRSGRT